MPPHLARRHPCRRWHTSWTSVALAVVLSCFALCSLMVTARSHAQGHHVRISRHSTQPDLPTPAHPRHSPAACALGAFAAFAASEVASLPATILPPTDAPAKKAHRILLVDSSTFIDLIASRADEAAAAEADHSSSQQPKAARLKSQRSMAAAAQYSRDMQWQLDLVTRSNMITPLAKAASHTAEAPVPSSPASRRPLHLSALKTRLAALNATGPSADESFVLVPLLDYHSVMYTGQIGLGTPAQLFDVIFDTGSSCLWVVSAAAAADAERDLTSEDSHVTASANPKKYLHYYRSEQSSSYSSPSPPVPWSIQYGVGEASGFLSNDSLTLGTAGSSQRPVTAHGQVFAEATRLSGNFLNKQQPMDGIVGLAFPGGACSDFPNAVDTLANSGVISSRVFSFFLDSADDDADLSGAGVHDRSVLVIGEPALALYEESALTYTRVLRGRKKPPSMWFVKLQALRVEGAPAMAYATSLCDDPRGNPCAALPDTGTSFLTAPLKLFARLINAITAGRGDCLMDRQQNVFCLDGPDGLPDLVFTFEGRDFVLRAQDYVLPNKQLAIQRMDFDVPGVDILILGDAFLRRVYTVFDMDRERVGFGHARSRSASSTAFDGWHLAFLAVGLTLMVVLCLAANWWIWNKQRAEYEPLIDQQPSMRLQGARR